jgi:uncharacterized protein YndB with AHSA1/START domain
MKIVKYTLGALAVVVVIILGIASTKPSQMRVERKATIKASPEKLFGFINDMHNWTSWSPWEKLDPNMKRKHSGASSGKGAVYEWEGNKDVGKGRMEIIDSVPNSKIFIKLDCHLAHDWPGWIC